MCFEVSQASFNFSELSLLESKAALPNWEGTAVKSVLVVS